MIPSKISPLRVVMQHSLESSSEEIKTLFEQLLVPIVPKAFLQSDIRKNQESLITNIFPTFKCIDHPIFATKENKWGLTFFTAFHSHLKPVADVVLFLDYDTYGELGCKWLKRTMLRDWSDTSVPETIGSLLIGSAIEKGADLIVPRNTDLINGWARDKANLCAVFLNFSAQPGGVVYEIFNSFETHFDRERRATIKLVN